jgi:hypothetical protein
VWAGWVETGVCSESAEQGRPDEACGTMLEVTGVGIGNGYVVVFAGKRACDWWVNEVRVSCCMEINMWSLCIWGLCGERCVSFCVE